LCAHVGGAGLGDKGVAVVAGCFRGVENAFKIPVTIVIGGVDLPVVSAGPVATAAVHGEIHGGQIALGSKSDAINVRTDRVFGGVCVHAHRSRCVLGQNLRGA
jgi:hypothetical protein